jgi:hypothetical protein
MGCECVASFNELGWDLRGLPGHHGPYINPTLSHLHFIDLKLGYFGLLSPRGIAAEVNTRA